MNLLEDLRFCVDLVRQAGQVALKHFGRAQRLTKRHAEAVTAADRETQRFIISGLRSRFPGDGLIGEENDTGDAITFECPDPQGRVWVIDPIDGTNNFIAGLQNFAVCVGLLEAGQPVLGVVYDVCRNQMYSAARGSGAFLDGQPIAVVQTPLGDSSMLMLTANMLDKDQRLPGYAIQWLGQTKWKVRMLGSAALEAMQVAAGVAHAALTVNGKLWDVAAPAAIVLAAGGVVTDLGGRSIFPFHLANYDGAKVPFLAAAPMAHAQLISQLQANP